MTSLPGINIQWPISTLILSGEKVVETRTYPIPQKYLGKDLAFIETPGQNGKFKARIRAIICFNRCFEYKSRDEFYDDFERHKVDPGSEWKWTPEKGKWGWELQIKKIFPSPLPAPKKRGIIFSLDCEIAH